MRTGRRSLVIRIEPPLWKKIDQVCKQNGWTKQTLYERALIEYMDTFVERYDISSDSADIVLEEASRQLESVTWLIVGAVRAKRKGINRDVKDVPPALAGTGEASGGEDQDDREGPAPASENHHTAKPPRVKAPSGRPANRRKAV